MHHPGDCITGSDHWVRTKGKAKERSVQRAEDNSIEETKGRDGEMRIRSNQAQRYIFNHKNDNTNNNKMHQ